MVLCEQFVFTSSKLEDGGYQVTSKSTGITSDTLKELENYLYPLGIDPSEFVESKSLLILKDGIAFVQSKNIGIGFDGRPDTMYSHIIVMKKDDFKKFENDSRIFNEYFSKITKTGHLTPLSIEHVNLEPDFMCIDIIGIIQFRECLNAIFQDKKIAIINENNQKIIQSLLSLIPPSFRLISFSSLVPQPEIQKNFEIIQTLEQKKSELKKYVIIDTMEDKQSQTKERTTFDMCLNYLIQIIDKKNISELKTIHDEFENVPLSDVKEKLLLILGNLLLESNKAYEFKQELLDTILTIIGKIPTSFSKKYWKLIRNLVPPDKLETYALNFEIEQILSEFNTEKITLDVLLSMFYSLKNNDSINRRKLLQELFIIRKDQLLRDGSQLLINANYSSLRTEIINLYIRKEILNKSILDLFKKNHDYDLPDMQKRSMYDEFVKKSSKINIKLAMELLSNPQFDLSKEYESESFRHLINDTFENIISIKTIEEEQVLSTIKAIFTKVKNIIEFKPKSGTQGTDPNNLKQLIKILKILLRFLNKIKENSKDHVMRNEAKLLEDSLKDFINKHPIEEEKPRRWLFWNIFGNYE